MSPFLKINETWQWQAKIISHKEHYLPQCLGEMPIACNASTCSRVWGNPSITQPFFTQSNSLVRSSRIFTQRSVGIVCSRIFTYDIETVPMTRLKKLIPKQFLLPKNYILIPEILEDLPLKLRSLVMSRGQTLQQCLAITQVESWKEKNC